MAFTDQHIVVGNTVSFQATVRLNNVVWDITGATVLIYIRDPDGNWDSPFTATIDDGPAGHAEYTVPTTTFDDNGTWVIQWKFSKAGIVKWSDQIEFEVYSAAA